MTPELVQLFGYIPELKDYIILGSLLLNIVLGSYIFWKYYFSITAFARIRVRKFKKDFPEYKIQVKNTGIIPLELDAPIILFQKRGAKRLFQVRNGQTQYPLALFSKEEYDFIIDLARFYATDSSLITYKNVYIELRDKQQRKLSRKRIRIQ